MDIRRLGRTDLCVTELCFGVLPLGPRQRNIEREEAVRLLKLAMERGVNFFDTAELYSTQEYLGEAVAGYDRQKFVLATKSAEASYEGMKASVEKSLRELGTDYIDIYHLHAAKVTPAVFEERAGALECLLDLKAQGVVKAVGISTHSVPVVLAAAKRAEIDIVFPIINKLGRGILDGSRDEMISAIGLATAAGKGVYAMKALAGGHLADEAEDAISYVRRLEGISSVAVGMVNEAELDYNVELFERNVVSADHAAAVQTKTRKLIILDSCVGCGTCVGVCPNNALKIVDGRAQVDRDLCIICGYCTAACPEFALRIA